MGEGNPNRKPGVGRSAEKGWQMEQILASGGQASKDASTRKGRKDRRADVIDFSARRPVEAGSIHSGPSISVGIEKSSDFQAGSVKKKIKKPYSLDNDLAHWSDDDSKVLEAVAEVLDKASDEKLAKIEKEIAEFSPAEQRFVEPMAEEYPSEFWRERRKREKKGLRTTDSWVSAFRDSYINKRLSWGSERKLAPEKADLLERYLFLKLPVGIPEEKPENKPRETEKVFTLEQTREVDDFADVVEAKLREMMQAGNFNKDGFTLSIKAAFRKIFKEDYISEGIFSAEDEERAMQIMLDKIEKKLTS